MKRSPSLSVLILTFILLIPLLCYAQDEDATSSLEEAYHVAAYVWPSCHYEERNASVLWPEETGEWEIIRKGTPRF